MNAKEIIEGTRLRAGLFRTDARGLLRIEGEDRSRWLDGMISGDISRLEKSGAGSGCYAMLLTNRGKIVADLHVGLLAEGFILECPRAFLSKVKEALERFIIADDVKITDEGSAVECLGLEGPKAAEILASATDGAFGKLAPDQWRESEIDGAAVRIGAFGSSGEDGFQIFVARDEGDNVFAAINRAGEGFGLVDGDAQALEILRVEAGTPVLGAELDDGVLPPEARLEQAISTDKGCYVGQEIVARLRSRGQVNHLLVGLRFPGEALPALDTEAESELRVGDRKTGRITSLADSPTEGSIGLGFVRREHSEHGTEIEYSGGIATVAKLPFVSRAADAPLEPRVADRFRKGAPSWPRENATLSALYARTDGRVLPRNVAGCLTGNRFFRGAALPRTRLGLPSTRRTE